MHCGSFLRRDAEHNGGRAIVDDTGGAEAPIDVVAARREVDRLVALVAVAEAEPAHVLPATVIVRNDVVLAVGRVATGADPGHRRLRRARRATVLRTAAAAAQKA